MARYYYDLESNGLLPTMDRIHSLVLIDADTDEMHSLHGRDIYDGIEALQDADEVIGHNVVKFDNPAIRLIFPKFKLKGKVTDTLVISRLIFTNLLELDYDASKKRRKTVEEQLPSKLYGSHSLKAWGIRLGELKGDFGDTTDWSEWTPEMQSYCEQDVRVTRQLHKHFEKQNYSANAIKLEHEFAEIMGQQERHGFVFDEVAAAELYHKLVHKRLEIQASLKTMFQPEKVTTVFIPKVNNKTMGYVKGVPFEKTKMVEFNPSSRQMIASRLKALGWKPEEFTTTGQPKVDETILSKLPYPEAKVLSEHFLIEKRIGQLAEGEQAWLRLVRKGRIHGSVNTNGAVTGRCTHSNPNVAQVPSVGAPYGSDCRSLFTVPSGYSLVGADLSGLELRCLAHFMARYDNGAYGEILLTGDIHWLNVTALGLTSENRNKEDKLHGLYRDGAKTFIYGFLYGAGDLKIGMIVYDIILKAKRMGLEYQSILDKFFKGNETPTEDQLKAAGKKLKKSFLDKTPALKKLRQAVTAAAERGYLLGLDGRKLHIRSPHAALNTLLQSAGALISKQATIFAYQDLCTSGYKWGKDFAFVAHVHDEIQAEAREGLEEIVGSTLVNAMRKAGEHFSFRCPIDGEFKFGKNWKDTH